MRFNILSLFFLFCILLVGVTAFFLIKKYYISYNLIRLDPLEENKLSNTVSTKVTADIWLLGDSRIARWDKHLLNPFGREIVNLGIEGQTSAQVFYRLKNYLETGNPKWIILEVGINDLKIIGIEPKMAVSIQEGCYRNITSIIRLCKDKKIKVIVISIFLTGKIEPLRQFLWNSNVNESISQLNAKLKSYCLNNKSLFFNANNILSADRFTIKSTYQDGFLHINEDAYKALSNKLINEYMSEINPN